MECRRCGKELPEGHTNICPHCGIRLDTYITPREREKKTKRKLSRNMIITMLSVAFVVIVVTVIIPFLRNLNMDKSMKNLEATYRRLAEQELQISSEGEREQWQQQVQFFSAGIKKHENSYPADEDGITKAYEMLDTLLGKKANEPERTELELQYIQLLVETAQNTIITIDTATLTKPNSSGECSVIIEITNKSEDKTIKEVLFALTALDKNGNPVPDSASGKADAYIRTTKQVNPGERNRSAFRPVWTNSDIAAMRIDYLTVYYTDSSYLYLPREVCSAIWGDSIATSESIG